MKIITICGHGLGSSFMLETIIKQILKEMNIEAEVGHTDLSSVASIEADIYFVGRDLADSVSVKNLVVLDSLINKVEIKDKLLVAIDNLDK